MHRTGGPPDRRTRQLDTAHLSDSVTIAVTDGDARVAYWSREAEDLLGYTSAEIIGRPLDDRVGADGAPLRHRDGSLLDTEVHLSPLLCPPSLSIYDRDARLLWANEATLRAVGFVQGEVRGRASDRIPLGSRVRGGGAQDPPGRGDRRAGVHPAVRGAPA